MDEKKYLEMVNNCENKDFEGIRSRMTDENIRLLHAAKGIVTEAGEILDQLKKHIFYGKELDKVNLKEELGDLEFYEAVMRDELGFTEEEVKQVNYNKLTFRYKKGFSKEAALNRDLENERKILEE